MGDPGPWDVPPLRLPGFTGPPEELLELARRHPAILAGVAMDGLAERCLALAAALPLAGRADHLVMAAALVERKARWLADRWGAPPDPAEAERLEALQAARDRLLALRAAGLRLLDGSRLGRDRFARGGADGGVGAGVGAPVRRFRGWTVPGVSGAGPLDRKALVAAYDGLRDRHAPPAPPLPPPPRLVAPGAARRSIARRLADGGAATLEELAGAERAADPLLRRSLLAAHLMGALELARDGAAVLRQDDAFGTVTVTLPPQA
ncbi:hypothetical protein HL658_35795 [Azospirillum sp. RWY-5-1]|uniref:Segregation and condensation protein A n=1 Tax=Azospirillum oleiclasticum TaxID=2735135 RepID=A0ABX2TK49_9PROT|nr:hypothetical protein [Azospirillum oleiclasticum]NYZ17934.1 hypothetical protein [Azospirillum oleiclasticum]NYZ24616.1 hypothetical protein [Azospirillum oleiclasticum]